MLWPLSLFAYELCLFIVDQSSSKIQNFDQKSEMDSFRYAKLSYISNVGYYLKNCVQEIITRKFVFKK